MKKIIALFLSLVMLCMLTIPALAAAPVTPTAPDWINAEDYIIFPDDEVYQPENWAKVLELRRDAANGALLPQEGQNWAEGSAGMRYEIGLVRLKYAENAGVTTTEGRHAFYSAYRAFSAAASAWYDQHDKQPDEIYHRIHLTGYRASLLHSYNYISKLGYLSGQDPAGAEYDFERLLRRASYGACFGGGPRPGRQRPLCIPDPH